MSHAILHEITLLTLTCCNCDVVFAMPDHINARLRRDGGSFWFPSGHQQHFTETETMRLRRLLDAANRTDTELAASYATLQREQRRVTTLREGRRVPMLQPDLPGPRAAHGIEARETT